VCDLSDSLGARLSLRPNTLLYFLDPLGTVGSTTLNILTLLVELGNGLHGLLVRMGKVGMTLLVRLGHHQTYFRSRLLRTSFGQTAPASSPQIAALPRLRNLHRRTSVPCKCSLLGGGFEHRRFGLINLFGCAGPSQMPRGVEVAV